MSGTEDATVGTGTGLEHLSDEQLAARREHLAFDLRSDPQLRVDLQAVEDEIARRARAGRRKHGTRH